MILFIVSQKMRKITYKRLTEEFVEELKNFMKSTSRLTNITLCQFITSQFEKKETEFRSVFFSPTKRDTRPREEEDTETISLTSEVDRQVRLVKSELIKTFDQIKDDLIKSMEDPVRNVVLRQLETVTRELEIARNEITKQEQLIVILQARQQIIERESQELTRSINEKERRILGLTDINDVLRRRVTELEQEQEPLRMFKRCMHMVNEQMLHSHVDPQVGHVVSTIPTT